MDRKDSSLRSQLSLALTLVLLWALTCISFIILDCFELDLGFDLRNFWLREISLPLEQAEKISGLLASKL